MRLVTNYEEFCTLYDQGKVKPDVSSLLGLKSVAYLRKQGWNLREGGLFRRSKVAEDLLAICRQSPENFQLAFTPGGIDFWTNEPA